MLASVIAYATEAIFYFDDLKIKAGTSQTVTLKIYNDLEAKGFQLTVTLPSGLTFVSNDVEQLGRLSDAGYMVNSSVKNNNTVLNIMGVNTGSRMEIGDGDMLSFNIQAAENATLGTSQIAMSNLKITLYDTANRNITLENFNQDIKVYTTYNVAAIPNKDTAGSITGTGEYENGTNATLTAIPDKGYSFTKWSNDVADNPYSFAVNSATTLTAEFTPITYAISYDLAGGALAEGVTNASSYTIESDDITLSNPTRKGYTFTGWTGTDLTEATEEVTIAKGSTEDRSYTATWTPIEVELDEDATEIFAFSGAAASVNVKRTILADIWNTICLPFTMTKAMVETVFGTDVEIAEFTGYETTYSTSNPKIPNAITLNFSTYTLTDENPLPAGKPFLIKTNKGFDSFSVSDVTISSTLTPTEKTDGNGTPGSFVGTFVNTTVPTNALFVSDGKLWYSKGKSVVKAFRGWFVLGNILGQETDSNARLIICVDGETTGIDDVKTMRNADKDVIYNLSGQRVSNAGRGIYIVNGKKVLKK